MRLLMADLARRNRWGTAFMMVMLLGMLGGTSMLGVPVRAYGVSMAVAFTIGTSAIRNRPRALWYLPLSRRDIWRGSWLYATVGATALTTAAKLLVMLVLPRGSGYGLAGIPLSSTYDFAYAGIGCACLIAASEPRPLHAPWRQVSALTRGVADFALGAGMLVAFYSFGIPGTRWAEAGLHSNFMAAHWSDLTMRSGTVLVAGLAITIGTYFYSPAPPPRLPQGGLLFKNAVPPARASRREREAPRRELVKLSGLPRLLLHEYGWTLLVAAGLAGIASLGALAVAIALRSPQTVGHFLIGKLLVFGGTVPPPQARGLDVFTSLFWYALFGASLAARFPAMLRHLRVLPLSVRQLNTLLVGWPVLVWLSVWTAFAALHYIVAGRGLSWWHVAFFAALAGSGALFQALTLRLAGVLRVFSFSLGAGVVPFLGLIDAPSAAVLALIGIGGLAAAALLNHAALHRSSTYRTLGTVLVAHGPGMARAG